jgi:hypothetical protein
VSEEMGRQKSDQAVVLRVLYQEQSPALDNPKFFVALDFRGNSSIKQEKFAFPPLEMGWVVTIYISVTNICA